jgi:rfaE bifunctional protein nucleotidyltransferase chain/domain
MTEQKIKTVPELEKTVFLLKNKKKKIVFTNGCFDMLHYGHLKYLESAKRFGDILIVAVNSDYSVKKIKGKLRPINKERDRLNLIAGLECVDYCLIFKDPTPYAVIGKIKPDILVKGGDWKRKDIIGSDIVRSYGGKVRTINFVKGYSTTSLIKKIVKIEK